MSETLFATELTRAGLTQLCRVPTGEGIFAASYSESYALHVGLHSYTNGLERLCKLALACHGYVSTGGFPRLRPYGHKLSELLDAVESLDMAPFDTRGREVARPHDDFEAVLVEALDRFAQGSGRYEHLDSLSNDDINVTTLDTWAALCARATVPERVKEVRSLHGAVISALRTLSTREDVEASAYSLLDSVDGHLSDPSIAVALRLYDRASWVATILDVATYYTNAELPLLGEAVRDLQGSGEDFFQYLVVHVEDRQVVEEEMRDFYRRYPDDDEDDDWDEDGETAGWDASAQPWGEDP